jgi:hypothetical protein
MRRIWGTALLVGASVGFLLGPQQVFAQACKDEVSMLEGSKQALVELTETVKKESVPDFERNNHQKSAVNKLMIHISMLQGLVSCLEKAAQDPSAPKAEADAARTQHDAAAKLQEKIQQERGAIKGAEASKDAKALVEKIDLTV